MKKKINIYVLLDPLSCKVRYIGITTQSILKRFNKHIQEALYSKNKTYKINWIKKLISEHRLPVVKKLTEVNDWQTALKIERNLIKKYKISRNLTNNEDYIDGAFKKTITNEQKIAASIKAKSFYEKGGKCAKRIEIKCFKKDGSFFRTFESMTEASKVLNLSLRHILLVVKGKKPQLKGYIFRKISDEDPSPIVFDSYWGTKKKIEILDLETGVSKIYNSYKEAAIELNVTTGMITYYLKNSSSLKNKKLTKL